MLCECWVTKRFLQQESPPAWTQEAYRPQCSRSWKGTYLSWGVPTFSRGYIPWPGGTYLGLGVSTLAWGYLPWLWGCPPWLWGYLPWPGGTYLGLGVSTLAWGYLPWLWGFPPWPGVPTFPWEYPPWPGGYLPWPEEYPTLARMGCPTPRCEQTENITFPHPSDAVGNDHGTNRLEPSGSDVFSEFLKKYFC